MSFVVSGLSPAPFLRLFGADAATLAQHGAVRRVVDRTPGYPCRISLEDAEAGDTVLLLNFEHQAAATPYRSSHAIYVSEAAREPARFADQLPPVFRGRAIALRAFDTEGMLVGAELIAADGDLKAAIERGLASGETAYLHAHNAAYGCFAARIDRAGGPS